ncbi:glycoside hydrolase family 16 protein [Collybiopsis luxurians FD-317 M1]|nr:glycoside hydrolase family 16 protein [Collybiopsis luxurians FD-317 M1]
MLLHSLPIYFILFLLYIQGAFSSNVFSRAAHRTHQIAARHTKSLARDLRIAFGAVLASDPSQQPLSNGRTVYCKSNGGFAGSSGGQGNSTSSSPGSSSNPGSSTKSASAGGPTASPVSTPWKLVEGHNGSDFFQGWSFFTGSDPTHGVVDYLDEDDAQSSGLAYVNSAGHAVMAVDTTNNLSGNRKSVRITTNSHYDQGIWILDAVHMPTGCGTWPAFWTNGPNWPAGGEIDIVEGVNDYIANQATIHTNPGCSISSSNSNTLGITGTVVGGTNCAAAETNNQGCGVRAASNVSFGAAFNNNGGGVYASKLDDTGVSIYFWPADEVPGDILAGTPQPSGWGKPLAMWAASGCTPSTFFYQQSAIFDTTFCGDWSGSVWSDSGIPGQEQSCAQRTGYSTCEAFVKAEGSAFSQAYWEIKSVKIYQYKP